MMQLSFSFPLKSGTLCKCFWGTCVALLMFKNSSHSPHNPTGKVFTKDELDIIAAACQRRDVLAVTDEV